MDVERADCEMTNHLVTVNHSTKMFAKENPKVKTLTHPFKPAQVEEVLSRVPDLDVYFALDTADTATCGRNLSENMTYTKIPAVVSDSYLPDYWVDHQLFIPIHNYLWKDLIEILDIYPSDIQSYNIASRSEERVCYWRGGPSGHTWWQSFHHEGRTACSRNETDRQCVLGLGSLEGLLNTSFGKHPNIIQNPRAGQLTDVPGCILAMDGYGFAGIFSFSLLQGSLTVRVGGYKHDASPAVFRRGDFAWYEPLLVEGKHYFRTDIDDMRTTIPKLFHLSSDARAAVALNGLRAARDLFSRRSIDCYVTLAAKNFVEYYTGKAPNDVRT